MKTPSREDIKKYAHRDEPGDLNYGFIAGCYKDLSTALDIAFDLIPKTVRRPSFLDVGCGTGNMLVAAYTQWLNSRKGLQPRELTVAGIEFREDLAALAQAAFLYHDNILVGDAMEFTDYGRYDIIYWYHPISDQETMKKLEDKIEKEAKKGAILLCKLRANPEPDPRRFRKLDDYFSSIQIYQKK